ncbi:Thioesterase domain protein [Aspergillus sclerotialis]|uniref:Thioesterase domain protein n=1 Tax=Aspergillus sclerotialis TaxID=2070753 RepID=A0A3A2ZUG0_9EURO|nr:Thioesterase domain protein [Aspergillus sclerotialis]
MTLTVVHSLLQTAAARNGDGRMIVYSHGRHESPRSYTYRELLKTASKASAVLRSNERYTPGAAILLHFNNHLDNIVWFWAVLLAGCIPAITPAFSNNQMQRAANLEHISSTLLTDWCLTSEALLAEFAGQHAIEPIAVETLGWEKASLTSNVVDFRAKPKDDAILLFTSGSTGKSKAVCLSHSQILSAIYGKYSVVPLPEQSSFLNWVGLDHVAAIVEIHLQALYAGKDQVHAPGTDVLSNPIFFLDLVANHRVSRTFAPNFFLAKIRDALVQNTRSTSPYSWDLSSLRYIASGGEANVTKTCDELSQLLKTFGAPLNVIVPGFGMTETCAGAIFNTNCPEYEKERALEYTSVGVCMPGIFMRVTDEQGKPLPPGELGYLELAGPVVFRKYLNNPAATQESFTSDGWFKTGDCGYLDENGYLNLNGRAKETIIINGVKYSPHEIETAVEEHSIKGLARSFTCCFSSLPADGETEEIFLVYLPTYAPDDIPTRAATADAISKVVLMSTGSRPHVIPLEQGLLQKSALGKLSRSKIKAAYEKGEYRIYEESNRELIARHRDATRASPANDLERGLLATFVESFDISGDELDVQTPIFDVGIDSIALVNLKRSIEQYLGFADGTIPITMLLENTTVRELANALDNRYHPKEYNPVVTLQAHGEKNPIWLVHPGAGEVLIFINLAKFITDRPVYALRARGFNEGEEPFNTIEEAVNSYYNGIKSKQPHGPYALAGYCYGSMLAFEVAKKLEANGDEVRFVGSFNLPPHIKMRMRELDWKECLLHLAYFLDLMTQKRSRELVAELEGLDSEAILQAVIDEADKDRYAQLSLSRQFLARWGDVAYELHRIAGDYDPSGCVAGMDVFFSIPLAIAAASKSEWRNVHLSQWDEFTRSDVRFHDVPGEHYSMIGPEHVFAFQKILRRALAERGM